MGKLYYLDDYRDLPPRRVCESWSAHIAQHYKVRVSWNVIQRAFCEVGRAVTTELNGRTVPYTEVFFREADGAWSHHLDEADLEYLFEGVDYLWLPQR